MMAKMWDAGLEKERMVSGLMNAAFSSATVVKGIIDMLA
jgi:hypothetical protein